jgi:hypothetical protein
VKLVALGLVLTGVVTGVLGLAWGRTAVVPGLTFGGLATAIQVVAVAAVRPVWHAPYEKFMGRWLAGIGLRFGGIVAIVVAVLANRNLYPPLPTAFAYLGVLLPLLFTETRFLGDSRDARAP